MSALAVCCLLSVFAPPHVAAMSDVGTAPSSSVHSTDNEVGALHSLRDYAVLLSESGAPLPHFDASNRHLFHSLGVDGTTVEYAHRPSESAVRDADGLYQPFPASLTLTFSAFNRSFSLPLALSPPPFDATSRIEVMSPYNERLAVLDAVSSSYRWTAAEGATEWATVTLREDGRFHLVMQAADGEVLQADPVEHFRHDMEPSRWHAMSAESERGMMIYRHSDLTNVGERQCGGDGWDADEAAAASHSPSNSTTSGHSIPSSSSSRRLLQTNLNDFFPTAQSERGIPNFGCLSSTQRLSIAVLADAGFSALFGGRPNDIVAAVSSIFSVINVLYVQQLSLFLTVTSLQIYLKPNPIGGPNPWNLAPPAGSHGAYCNDPSFSGSVTSINAQLVALDAWRQTYQPTNGGQHHLMTNCWPAPGIVGLSYYNDICLNQYAESVSSFNAPYWITVGHEIAHTLGAQHTFGGGGLMDYGNGAHYPMPNGPYQFNPVNQDQICWILNDQMYSAGIEPYCMQPYLPTCGNGVVEAGEQCDDSSACCKQCALAVGAQCSGNSTCCLPTCQYAPSSTLCASNSGLCANGQCLFSSCPSQYPLCGLSAGGCQQLCQVGSACVSLSGAYALPDNITCSLSPYGVCRSGQCAVTAVTYSYATSAWSVCSCAGTQSRTVICSGSDGNSYPLSTCTGAQKAPATDQSCVEPSSCYSYAFSYSSWSACSASCDGGVQSRTAACLMYSTPVTTLPLANCTAAGVALQALSADCNAQACSYSWQSSAFGACSVDCGGGVQTRLSTCWRAINDGTQQMTAADCVAHGLSSPCRQSAVQRAAL